MNDPNKLAASKPTSIWKRPVKLSFGKLFQTLGKGTIDVATTNWGAAAKDGVEVVSALGLKREASEIAWLLIQKSLLRGMLDLTESNQSLLSQDTRLDLNRLGEQLDLTLEQGELALDSNFFQKPEQLAIVELVKTPYQRWLQTCGASSAEAKSISLRLPSYFVYALCKEWASGKETYACLKEQLDTPFAKASQQEQTWENYSAWLQQVIDEPLFSLEAFSLKQIYVPLRAYYEREAKEPTNRPSERTVALAEKLERVVVDLQTELEAWITKADKDDAVRVICGGPGCGKSSFTKVLAAHCVGLRRVRVLFVPLHLIEPSKDLTEAVGKYIENDLDELLPPNPLKKENAQPRLLLIFDGLDELAMQGKVAAEVAQQFILEVKDKVNRANQRETHLQVLISGRDLVVQANSSQFRHPEQILHVLPYYEREETLKTQSYIDEQDLLRPDQRQIWWQRYGELTGRDYTGLPEELARAKLTEITAQPLLNYLVALSYTGGDLDFTQENNLNSIYADLLQRIYRRDWERYQHPTLGDISQKNFTRILEEIAVACWHGNGRTTTVSEIESHCVNSGLQNMLTIFQEGAKAGVTRLLAAFYFRQSGLKGAEKTFEFTHKSFGEYLTARRILLEVESIDEEFARHQKNFDRGWNEQDCLKRWALLCGSTAIDEYLFNFIWDEVQLQNRENVRRWQQTLCRLISYMLRRGMPMEKLELTYHAATQQARNAEEALLAVLNACAQVTQIVSQIDWETPEAFGTWLSKLQGQRSNDENSLALLCLSYLDLQSRVLFVRDLLNANLRGSNLQWANLQLANLQEANLQEANLQWANLQLANLQEANLQEANLQEANLQGANLQGANLQEANLQKVNLQKANLQEANLLGAKLQQANLQEANLQGANLQGANLQGANLQGANLQLAKLPGAKLQEANLQEAKLQGANLQGANLQGAKLYEYDLQGGNLEGVDLDGVVFVEAEPSELAID
jgi:uncharacterized protein YjbI with pentapeptide repeats